MYTINIPEGSPLHQKASALAAAYHLPAEVLVETLLMAVVRHTVETTQAEKEVPA